MPRPKLQRNEIQYKYSKHEIVWAKIAGFPWWPACITCTPSKTNSCYKVDFIGDRSYAYLTESKIARYVDLREQYQLNKKNNKHFDNAVTIAARKHEQLLAKHGAAVKSKGSVECKTSQQKQQLNQQIQLAQITPKIQQIHSRNQKAKTKLKEQSRRQVLQNKQPKIEEQIIPQILPTQKTCQQQYQSQNASVPEPLQKASHEIESESCAIRKDKRESIIEQLLIKYKLNFIPTLREAKQSQKQNNFNEKRRIHWKRKLIFKNRQSSYSQPDNELGTDQMLTRKIYRFLIRKMQSPEECRLISLSLKDQIVNQKLHKIECLKKAMEWISISEPQNVSSYHSNWINFYKDSERQRQKHSHLTMEEESEQLLMK